MDYRYANSEVKTRQILHAWRMVSAPHHPLSPSPSPCFSIHRMILGVTTSRSYCLQTGRRALSPETAAWLRPGAVVQHLSKLLGIVFGNQHIRTRRVGSHEPRCSPRAPQKSPASHCQDTGQLARTIIPCTRGSEKSGAHPHERLCRKCARGLIGKQPHLVQPVSVRYAAI